MTDTAIEHMIRGLRKELEVKRRNRFHDIEKPLKETCSDLGRLLRMREEFLEEEKRIVSEIMELEDGQQ